MKPSVVMLIILVGLSFLSPSLGLAKETINWKTYDEGVALSRQEDKKLFVHFFADW